MNIELKFIDSLIDSKYKELELFRKTVANCKDEIERLIAVKNALQGKEKG